MTPYQYIQVVAAFGLPKRSIVFLILLSFFATLIESAGLSLIIPIYEYIDANGDLTKISDSFHWKWLKQFSEYFDLEIKLGGLLFLVLVMVILRQIVSFSRYLVTAIYREGLIKKLRDSIFSLFLKANLAEQENLKGGELVNILTNELTRFSQSIMGFVTLVNATILIGVYSIILIWTSWQMTAIIIFMSAFSILPIRVIYRLTAQAGKQATQANMSAVKFFIERLSPVRLIRLARTEDIETDFMGGFSERQKETILKLERYIAMGVAIIEPIILAMGFGVIYVAIEYFQISMANLAIFIVIIVRFLPVTKDIIKGWQIIQSCSGSIHALETMKAGLQKAKEPQGGGIEFTGLYDELCFRSVGFKYNDERYVLNNINFTLKAGSFVALIGPSGSGKSTLIDLLPALRFPSDGDILFDGRSIREFSLTSLRTAIAYVSQTPQLYDIPIAEHVRLGKFDATDEEVKQALELAGAMDFINKLSSDIYTPLGQFGVGLSGGQRQRIDIARALISKASILILDEPTSALDIESERAFLNMLRHLKAKQNLTILAVTHKPALMDRVDQVIVLKNGKIDASGTIEDVTSKSEWFGMLFKNAK